MPKRAEIVPIPEIIAKASQSLADGTLRPNEVQGQLPELERVWGNLLQELGGTFAFAGYVALYQSTEIEPQAHKDPLLLDVANQDVKVPGYKGTKIPWGTEISHWVNAQPIPLRWRAIELHGKPEPGLKIVTVTDHTPHSVLAAPLADSRTWVYDTPPSATRDLNERLFAVNTHLGILPDVVLRV